MAISHDHGDTASIAPATTNSAASSSSTVVDPPPVTLNRDKETLPPSTSARTRANSTMTVPIPLSPSDTAIVSAPPLPSLGRTVTNRSIHAQNSLRRMVTHETGEFVCEDRDGARLDAHEEDLHAEAADGHSQTLSDEHPEAAIKAAEVKGHDDDDDRAIHPHDEDEEEEDDDEVHDTHEVDEKRQKRRKKREEPELQDQTNLLPTKQVILVVSGLTCALFCSLLDQTIVTTALPTLGRVFNRADISPWVGTAYLLTSTSMQPIYGRLSDIFGRKFVLLGALTIFLIGSLACAVAQSMIQLIVFRAIQGMGGGGIITLAMIIISDVVTLKDRGKFQGIIGVVVATSNSLGPILGGVFTEKASWRWCFYINLPLTVLAIIIIIFLLPLRRVRGAMSEKLRTLDWYGSILTLAWAVLVLLALSWAGSQYEWDSAAVLAPLLIGLALLGVWLFVEARLVALPLVPMRIFRNGTVASAMATTFLSGIIFYSTLYYLPMYFQIVRGATAVRSGVLILPLVATQTVSSFTAGIISSRTGDFWWNLIVGFTVWTIGVGLLSSIDETTSVAKLAIYQMIDGVGAGQTFQTSLVAIQAGVARKDMATATGMRNFLRMLGGTLALTICSTILSNLVRAELGRKGFDLGEVKTILSDPTTLGEMGLSGVQRAEVLRAYARGIQACFWFMIPCSGIALFLTLFFTKRISLKREDDDKKKAEAKAWVESKKEKHRKAKGGRGSTEAHAEEVSTLESRSRRESQMTVHGNNESPSGGVKSKLRDGEHELEEAGRREEEAMGVQPEGEGKV